MDEPRRSAGLQPSVGRAFSRGLFATVLVAMLLIACSFCATEPPSQGELGEAGATPIVGAPSKENGAAVSLIDYTPVLSLFLGHIQAPGPTQVAASG